MTIHRRQMLAGAVAAPAVLSLSRHASAQAPAVFAPRSDAWRNYELVSRIEIAKVDGLTRAWLPLPSVDDPAWFKSGETRWTGNARSARIVRDPVYGAQMLMAEWEANVSTPTLEATSTFSTRDRFVDLSKPSVAVKPLGDAERALALKATALLPTDGIVKLSAAEATKGKTADLDKARAIYDWIVVSAHRNPKTRGCGVGDIASMLKTGDLGGKCADLNALFVGMCRASGIPARDIYGLRVAPSRFGYNSLGAGSEVVTRAQHCRAEAWIAGYGWVPADPADVRKVILEEPPANLDMNDPKVRAARSALFGSCEGNWLAYNTAHDVVLPAAQQPALGFFMYPQAESGKIVYDSLDPDAFKYRLTARAA
jgi:transglutaminase-like putative cysteine protease